MMKTSVPQNGSNIARAYPELLDRSTNVGIIYSTWNAEGHIRAQF
ncbi:MAG TPA: hypothetical protein VEG37_06315 [Burkholderiales bacterium]|nr:hypothetical protein [Burkholderiales bacterium]